MKNFGDLTELLKLESFTMCVPKTSFIAHYLRAEAKYEPHVSKYLLAHLRLGDTFVDVGANVGYYSLLAANIVGVGGQVISVEPDSLNVRCILKSKIINSLDMLELWPVSASESLKSEPILLDDSSNSGVRDLNRIIESEYDLIMGVPLDTILSSRFRVDVIKIDIEGREYRAMRGGHFIRS